ncbi:hypothetical protein Drose_06160 [Dactylosporangium roseum]|uniref:Uncharacterized protein n=1 Tax=Dactylosporangium roseum TaxID=47989 RepID=A0ABY5Z745_9ACTN|nr:hypothetical protein [Dactylosporangium roseum]UWZ37856.1 hypothetical protein Drose_06160 [Dactylosporangium roseum]
MLVTIVVVPNADNTGMDVDRMGKVEDIPDEVAVKMLQMGTAREPSVEELDTYDRDRAPGFDGRWSHTDLLLADIIDRTGGAEPIGSVDAAPSPARPRRRAGQQQPQSEPLPANPDALLVSSSAEAESTPDQAETAAPDKQTGTTDTTA